MVFSVANDKHTGIMQVPITCYNFQKKVLQIKVTDGYKQSGTPCTNYNYS